MKERLQHILEQAIDDRKVFGTSFCIRHDDTYWHLSSGNMSSDSPYFIASVTKLFTTALILALRAKGLLGLDDKIKKYLSAEILTGLHVLHGIEYSDKITVRHLLSHTSGLPDYFEDKPESGASLKSELLKSKDRYWSFEECVDISKTLSPLFTPGKKKKAHYSDTNFQLLGKIIENITGQNISRNYEDLLFRPLGLTRTYLYSDISDNNPQTLYYKDKELFVPQAMVSFGADGGIVSTSGDLMIFLGAFFSGILFPVEYIDELQQWNPVFFPFQAGIGIQRFKLMWILNPAGAVPELIGHSGLSGALAYYSARHHLYVAGTVNQVAFSDKSIHVAIKLIREVLKK
jgi:CubicO group peptidase (beta-lactamase class C family)